MKTCIRILIVSSAVAVASLTAGPSAAKSRHAPLLPAYVEECGSCHIAFPGRMLDAASWIAVLEGLEQHFGVDASVDAKTLEPIRAYLAGTRDRNRPRPAGFRCCASPKRAGSATSTTRFRNASGRNRTR